MCAKRTGRKDRKLKYSLITFIRLREMIAHFIILFLLSLLLLCTLYFLLLLLFCVSSSKKGPTDDDYILFNYILYSIGYLLLHYYHLNIFKLLKTSLTP